MPYTTNTTYFERMSHPKNPTLGYDLENTKNKAKDFII